MESNPTPDETAAFEDNTGDWFKIIIIGDAGVGKTSILLRFIEDKFIQTTTSIGYISDRKKTIRINGKEVQLHVWDTAGQERYMSITNRYYRETDAVIIVYDSCDPDTFQNIEKWYNEIITYLAPQLDDGMPVLLVGNKKDKTSEMPHGETVNFKVAQELAMNKDITACLETSAATGEGITELFEQTTKELLRLKSPRSAGRVDKIQHKKSKCCK